MLEIMSGHHSYFRQDFQKRLHVAVKSWCDVSIYFYHYMDQAYRSDIYLRFHQGWSRANLCRHVTKSAKSHVLQAKTQWWSVGDSANSNQSTRHLRYQKLSSYIVTEDMAKLSEQPVLTLCRRLMLCVSFIARGPFVSDCLHFIDLFCIVIYTKLQSIRPLLKRRIDINSCQRPFDCCLKRKSSFIRPPALIKLYTSIYSTYVVHDQT